MLNADNYRFAFEASEPILIGIKKLVSQGIKPGRNESAIKKKKKAAILSVDLEDKGPLFPAAS